MSDQPAMCPKCGADANKELSEINNCGIYKCGSDEGAFQSLRCHAAELTKRLATVERKNAELRAACQLVKDYLEVNRWEARKPYKPVCDALKGDA